MLPRNKGDPRIWKKRSSLKLCPHPRGWENAFYNVALEVHVVFNPNIISQKNFCIVEQKALNVFWPFLLESS
jgi:hypothetical protein